MQLGPDEILPRDAHRATLVGRLWVKDGHPGPRPVVVRNGQLADLSELAATTSELFELDDLGRRLKEVRTSTLGTLDEALAENRLLAPCDLQAVKAAGVTFADSVIERVIEERARGAPDSAEQLRNTLRDVLGGSLRGLAPGSAEAGRAKRLLQEKGLWSAYLEVAIGPDPEIFTKAQPLSSVGCGAAIGVHPDSTWSSSEPEVVLAVSARGDIVGATLGNDLTLRDFEGRSALLLTRAKDNNASCAIGPFVRVFDADFGLDDVRRAEVDLTIDGTDGFHAHGTNSLAEISRDPRSLVDATLGSAHQYPDGLMLFLGTMYVPNQDRHGPGLGFTHEVGDRVRVSSAALGGLVNEVTTTDRAPPWSFGAAALFRSLSARGIR